MFRNGDQAGTVGGRTGARRCRATVALIVCSTLALSAAANPQSDPVVTVSENDGMYSVAATFTVPQGASFALAALTDYSHIPRFMPAVRASTVLERADDRAVVEQEAVASFMMFSKRIHLVLEVQEERDAIRFRDRCGRSFARYQGRWTVAEKDGVTRVTYELSAKPTFQVPEVLLKRLLKRDAIEMIAALKAEIGARARQPMDCARGCPEREPIR
jgi:ribosome-associated toxin RatA of RatAB toxin-antitoxin module